jgi:hypothetical protein
MRCLASTISPEASAENRNRSISGRRSTSDPGLRTTLVRQIADILRGMNVSDAPEISNGPRSFHFAYLEGNKNKENTKKALQITQKFMIREAIALNLPLLNAKLTVIKTHSLIFGGKDIASSVFDKENSVAMA